MARSLLRSDTPRIDGPVPSVARSGDVTDAHFRGRRLRVSSRGLHATAVEEELAELAGEETTLPPPRIRHPRVDA